MSTRRTLTSIAAVVILVAVALPLEARFPERVRVAIEALKKLREGKVKHHLLNRQQIKSLEYVHYRDLRSKEKRGTGISLPYAKETATYQSARAKAESEALDYLDEFYHERDDLKALAVRDSDGDGIPDYRVSDYYGKFLESDLDVDGDSVRNVYDSHPYEAKLGGKDRDGDGVPDEGHLDADDDGLPDHVDWSHQDGRSELAGIQLGLFRDYQILLVDRAASFDLRLARAVDDAVRRCLRSVIVPKEGLATLRTVAVENTALLGAVTAFLAGDDTSAQVFSQTQSLTIYRRGRLVEDDIGLLGLVVHEIGHNYHMSLDYEADTLAAENAQTSFPAPNFVRLVKRFGWTVEGEYDGTFEKVLPVMPMFAYAGTSEPMFLYQGRTAEEWTARSDEIYAELQESPDYLEDERFVDHHIVGDYSMSTPYEWYADNLLAYVVLVLEEEALASEDDEEKIAAAKRKVRESLRAVWPSFDYRNLGPEIRKYYEETFPITKADRRALAARYITPIL